MNTKYMSVLKKITTPLQKASGTSERGAQIIFSIIIILLLNMALSTCNMRCDLTRAGSFSLSKKSREVVSSLRENMKVKVFFSENLPAQHRAVFRYLNDILEEYNYYGSRHFSYEIISEKNLEREAANYGIQPIQSQEFSGDQATLRRTYMGLVIQHADLVEKINALTNTVGLEYEITSRMEKMTFKVNALLSLKEPITVSLHYDSRLKSIPIRGIDRVEQAVNDAVQASAAANYNKLVFAPKDVALDTDVEKATAAYGPLSVVMTSGGRFKVINLGFVPTLFGGYAIDGLDTLEDNINNSIPALLGNSVKIGFLNTHNTVDIDDRNEGGGALMQQILSERYELVPVDLTQDIPSDIATLIINGPQGDFSNEELYRLDRFLMLGNAAIILIDSFEEMRFQQGMPMVIPIDSGLDEFLNFYGVNIGKSIVLDPNCPQITYRDQMGDHIVDYTLFPVILKNGLNRKNPITKYLNSVAFFKASPVEYDGEKLKEKGIAAEILASSSKDSWLMTDRVDFNPSALSIPMSGEFKSYPLFVEFSGKFESFFKDKESPFKGKDGQLQSAHKIDETIGSAKTRLIVAGTSHITRSEFLLNARKILSSGGDGEAFSNEILLHAMVDRASGNDHIPEMKSKSIVYNPIDKTGDATRLFLNTFNIAGAPVMIIITGLIIWRQRISRKKMIRKKFEEE
ncbi:MAG: GldG family protein [Leptospirales bacterium]|nr:GldG family protein [Leptospirales bacterium]